MKKIIGYIKYLLFCRDRSARKFESARYWQATGSVSPYSDAAHEMSLRSRLEDFREFANKRAIEDPALCADAIKEEWMGEHLKPMAKNMFARSDAASLKSAISIMPDREMFTPATKRVRDRHLENELKQFRADRKAAERQLRQSFIEGTRNV